MHSANLDGGRNKAGALPTTEEIGYSVRDGTARSALVILSKGQLTEFPRASRLREAIKDQNKTAVSRQLEAIGENQIQHLLLPNFPAFGGKAISYQPSAKNENPRLKKNHISPYSLPSASSF